MDVGIVTIQDSNNYGNRLQNYAVQEVIRALGHNAITIKNDDAFNSNGRILSGMVWKLECLLIPKMKKKINKQRKRNFCKFNQNIQYNKKYYFPCFRYDEYDYYITGSDQVWNPDYRLSDIDMLRFARPEKRISFAASFGTGVIPEEFADVIKNEIGSYKAISVREYSGQKILESHTGREDIRIVVDPTMMLTAEQWGNIAQKPTVLKSDRFVLCYFLGGIPEDEQHELTSFADQMGWELVDVLDERSPFHECGPAEFLYLEKHAELIFTDSFHACVFALLFDRSFVVFERNTKDETSMNTRIDTLVRKFMLEDRRYSVQYQLEDYISHDYTEAYKQLERERYEAYNFLKRG